VNIRTKLVDIVASESRWANSVRTVRKSASANSARKYNEKLMSKRVQLPSLSRAICTRIRGDDQFRTFEISQWGGKKRTGNIKQGRERRAAAAHRPETCSWLIILVAGKAFLTRLRR
jgi:hypothetical protein